MSPNAGDGGGWFGASANEYTAVHRSTINFGDLTPYLTYAGEPRIIHVKAF